MRAATLSVLNTIAISINILSVMSYDHVYVAKLINNEYDCNIAAGGSISPNDICIIDCDDPNPHQQSYSVECGESVHCMFRCNADGCFDSGSLFASNATILSVTSNAKECMRQSMVYVPNKGDAVFSVDTNKISTEGTFKEMMINDGINTNSIRITCSADSDNKECQSMTINAHHTQYLEIIAEDYATMDHTTIHCPQYSKYNVSQSSSACIINLSGAYVSAINLEIYTINGSPEDMTFIGSETGIYTDTVLYCNEGMSVINGNSFEGQLYCWMPSGTTYSSTESPTTSTTTTTTTTSVSESETTSVPEHLSTTLDPFDSAEVRPKTTQTLTSETVTSIPNNAIENSLFIQTEDLLVYTAVFVGFLILIIIILQCRSAINKEYGIKRGESEVCVMSQDIAPECVDNDNIKNGHHLIPISASSNSIDSMQQILKEGNISQIINTPEIPDLTEEITEEELIELKRQYNKKKSTLYCDNEYKNNDYNQIDQIDDDDEDDDSEELYIGNDAVQLQRYDTPMYNAQITSDTQSDHPIKTA